MSKLPPPEAHGCYAESDWPRRHQPGRIRLALAGFVVGAVVATLVQWVL